MLGSMASSSDVEAARAQNDEENDGSRMHAVNDGVAISKQVLRIVVVGCSGVGKSSLLLTLTSGGVFPDYVPSVGGDYYFALRVDGVHRHVSMWDTQGDEAYDKLRPHAYRGADAILLCYSVGRESMRGDGREESALRFWAAELRANCPRAPVVLCATKIDLRASHKKQAEGICSEGREPNLVGEIPIWYGCPARALLTDTAHFIEDLAISDCKRLILRFAS
jgi:small GTP-binding protein